MPPDHVLVTSHIHIDGPIPGPHSLLTLASAAHLGAGGGPISTFTANLRELPGAGVHPDSLRFWRQRADDWLTTRRGSRAPAEVAVAYARWLCRLPGRPTLVTDPIEPNYPFLYWYLQRFTGHWHFARTSTDVDLHDRLTRDTPPCPLTGCRSRVLAAAC